MFRTVVCLGALVFGCAALPVRATGNAVLDWNELMIESIRLDNSGPTVSSRNLAILHTSMYDAVNSILKTHQSYAFSIESEAELSAEAAAAGAGHQAIKTLYPGFGARADQLLAAQVSEQNEANAAAVTKGVELGRTIARLALTSRVNDGAQTDIPYIPSEASGQWRRTPPFFRPPLAPQWRYVDLFALPDLKPFLPPPPPSLISQEYASALNEVKSIGGRISQLRTEEQTEIAVFWSDFAYTSMPPGHWHVIAGTIARERGVSLPETARLFALLSVAQADAAVVCWEAKYRHNLWRPVTAIQRADEDGNPLTDADKQWDHLLAAPPFPSYTSGHSTFSKASAQVLTRFFETDAIDFAATSDSLPGVIRNFSSLSACADEVGMSRIYGGIHFRFDNTEGKKSGKLIGDFVAANWLLPIDTLPTVKIERIANGAAELRVHGKRFGSLIVLEASDDLRRWTPIATNIAARGGVPVHDSWISAARFFRAVER